MTSAAPGNAGWHPDPTGRFEERYWDGSTWTSAVKRGEQVESDPESVPEVSADGNSASPTTPSPASAASTGRTVAAPAWPQGGGSGDRQTSLSPPEAQREIVRVLPLAGILVKSEQPGQVHAAIPVKGETNVALVIILCFICIIPGIIYAIVSSRTSMMPATIQLASSPSGSTIITIQAAPGPRQAVLSALGTLPL